jgi:hypothetical protein
MKKRIQLSVAIAILAFIICAPIAPITDAGDLASRKLAYSAPVRSSSGYARNTRTRSGNYGKPLPSSANCSFSISPARELVGAGGIQGNISVTAPLGSCRWTVTEAVEWITIISGTAGVGSGTVTFSVWPNRSRFLRVANIAVAGRTFTVLQSGM